MRLCNQKNKTCIFTFIIEGEYLENVKPKYLEVVFESVTNVICEMKNGNIFKMHFKTHVLSSEIVM